MSTDLRRKKLLKTRKKIKEKSEGGNMIYVKADETKRVRPLPVDENEEFGMEIVTFFLGGDIKGVTSAATFGEPCPIMDKYEELKNGDEDDKALADKLKPKRKYVVPVILYEDLKGKKIDEKNSGKLISLTTGTYQDLIDLFLDEEQGDFTHPTKGYDVKISRVGSGQYDTEYSTIPCRPSKIPKKWNKIVDIEQLIRKEINSYEEAETLLNRFLNIDEDDEPKKKKKGKKNKKGIDFKAKTKGAKSKSSKDKPASSKTKKKKSKK